MNYCESFCQTIQRLCNNGGGLPAEYQQVEYLQNSGGTNGGYIDNRPPIHINTGVGYFADFEIRIRRINNNPTKFCGSGKNHCLQRNDSAGYASFWNGSSKYVTSNQITNGATYAWINNVIYVNNIQVSQLTKSLVNGEFTLYGCGAYEQASYYNDIQIYYCKLWDTYGDLTRHYIPCYRKSDNTPGMYDLVTDTFNAGTGTGYFIVGNNV